MKVESIEEEIRELCARMLTVDSSHLPEVAAELRAALKRHADQIRLMALKTLKPFPPSKSKAAD